MKRHFMAFSRHYTALMILLLLAIMFLIFPIPSSAGNESKAGDELISLKVKDEPLGNVLNKISVATGYDISLEDKWRNYRVTASLEEVSLHEGLKRILRNLNSAIIYVSSKKIQIIIYDKTASEDTSYASPTGQPPERTPPSQRPSARPWRQRQPLPTPQTIEKEDNSKTDEEPSDNTVGSDQESETGTPDSEGGEITKPESFEPDSNEEINIDSEKKSSEKNSGQDIQTEQTSDGKTENLSGDEDTNYTK